MKKLKDFVDNINEHRGRPRKNPDTSNTGEATNDPEDRVVENPEDARDLEAIRGLAAEDNESGGVWDIDPPTEDDIVKGIDRTKLNKNKKRILMHMKAGKPFFVQGEAGWAKTSIITKLAKQCRRTVLTVYLDKAEATDLGGIPVPSKSKRGVDSVKHLMPEWAAVMWDNPNVKFLLFFDEMNQAQPDVMQALMPIVLKNTICGHKFKNFIVGAAGNMDTEDNVEVNALPAPLLSRFGGILKWDKDWDDSIDFLKGKWGDKLSVKFLDEVFRHKDLFMNPRDVEQFILETVFNLRADKDYDIFDTDDFKEQLLNIARKDVKDNRSDMAELESLAETCYDYMRDAEKIDNRRGGSGKDISMVPENIRNAIKRAMKEGFIRVGGVNYGISKENIAIVTDPKYCNGEMLQRIINKYEIDGVQWRYKTDDQWRKDGYKEPPTDDFLINVDYKYTEPSSKPAKKSHLND